MSKKTKKEDIVTLKRTELPHMSPAEVRHTYVRAGIIDSDGKLTSAYKPSTNGGRMKESRKNDYEYHFAIENLATSLSKRVPHDPDNISTKPGYPCFQLMGFYEGVDYEKYLLSSTYSFLEKVKLFFRLTTKIDIIKKKRFKFIESALKEMKKNENEKFIDYERAVEDFSRGFKLGAETSRKAERNKGLIAYEPDHTTEIFLHPMFLRPSALHHDDKGSDK